MTDKPTLAAFAQAVLGQPIPQWQRAILDDLQGTDPKRLILPLFGRGRPLGARKP